jgi:hypothetical protein
MGIFNLFSDRQKLLKSEVSDVYRYDDLPRAFRVQIVHIWTDALGGPDAYNRGVGYTRDFYRIVVETLCREYGMFRLVETKASARHYLGELSDFFLRESDIDRCIDVVEITFRMIDTTARSPNFAIGKNGNKIADDAIEELNSRFQQHRIGYRFEGSQVIRIDSQLLHSEMNKPALTLLTQKHLSGAQQEFLRAHEHHRGGRPKEAINEALKALESTLKGIFDRRRWHYPANATIKSLIDKCFDEGLIPAFWASQMAGLRALLEGGIPPARNRLGSHGQGAEPTVVPDHIVSYVLHMTAATIVFLATADESVA